MSVEVELAGAADLPAIVGVANWAALHSPANFATAPEPLAMWEGLWAQTAAAYPWLVARAGATVVGFAKGGPHRARAAYAWTVETTVYVDPGWHGRGVGKALYGRLLPVLAAQGYVTAVAGITTPNPASERLHEGFGFVRCATFHRIGFKLGAWHDVGYWELALDPSGGSPGPIRPVAAVWSGGVNPA